MKSVLISVQPKWCAKICHKIGERDGEPIYEKRVEVRKTRPSVYEPFKVLIYCTKPNTKDAHEILEIHGTDGKIRKANGKVIGEFVCDSIDEFSVPYPAYFSEIDNNTKVIIENACLKPMDIHAYNGTHQTYGWHISDLVIYDKPRELSEFATVCEGLKPYQCAKCKYYYYESTEDGAYEECCCNNLKPITRPPQSWCYVEVIENGA